MVQVVLDITALSGTFGGAEGFSWWLEVSDDNGITWTQVPYDQQLTNSILAADQTANTDKRNISGTSLLTSGASRHIAIYKHLPGDLVRIAWGLDGAPTTPSATFSADLVGK